MKRILIILFSVLFSKLLLAQTKPKNNSATNTSNTAWIKAIPADDLIKWRQYIYFSQWCRNGVTNHNPAFNIDEKALQMV